jgi:hypothetical protein
MIGLLLAIPQLLYWLVKSGSPMNDSYKSGKEEKKVLISIILK